MPTRTSSGTTTTPRNWYWFAIKHSKRTKSLRNVYDLLASDVLQAGAFPTFTYHTSDTHNKSVKKIISDHPHTWWYAHRT